MHPDKPEVIDDLHAYFRQILVDGLTPAQLALHDYFSIHGPVTAEDDEEFPLFEGLMELLEEEDEYDYVMEEADGESA